jgi:hypothetical protein
MTNTRVFTATPTVTSPPATATSTRTPTATRSPTLTPTVTATRTPSPTVPPTASPTLTNTPIPTRSPTLTPSPTATRTATNTRTPTLTRTFTPTPTATLTPTITRTPTVTRTPTATIPPEPVITFFGVTNGDDHLVSWVDTTEDGTRIYERAAYGFSLVIEARPGGTFAKLGKSTFNWNPANPTSLPDLQIEASNMLGNGSPAVCDYTGLTAGGVPAIEPFDFSAAQAAAINDFSCRFEDGTGAPGGRDKGDACTKFPPSEDSHVVDPSSTIQYCGVITGVMEFPTGDTVVAAQVRDVAGNLSAISTIIIRVP